MECGNRRQQRTWVRSQLGTPHLNAHESPGGLMKTQSQIQEVWVSQGSSSLTSSQVGGA